MNRRGHDHRACVRDALHAAEALCAARGHRLTPLRRRVLELVWMGHEPVGAYAVLDRLRAEGLASAPPTVYRALDFLVAEGLVHRIESLNAFAGCHDPTRPHTGTFLICRSCGEAEEIGEGEIAAVIKRKAAESGFRIERHAVEVSGICARCETGA
jgi:Fur family zinc uptake transcriptional regulator